MRICTTKKRLTEMDIREIIQMHLKDAKHKKRLKAYYRGKHDILDKPTRAAGAPNNMIVANYCEYISNMSTGFFLGQPVAYSSASEDAAQVDALFEIFRYNDEAVHNLELAEEASITGEAYEILYIDSDARIRFASIPSDQVILVYDNTLEENMLYAIRHYRVYNLDQVTYREFVDVYDPWTVTKYSYNEGRMDRIGEPSPHRFGDVPIVEYPNNKQRRGDFEGVMTLVDAYNKAQSLTLDDMEDFTDAFLILRGMGGTNDDDVKELRKNKVIEVDGPDCGAEWLIKELNDTYIENIKTRLQKDIHKFSNIPDMSDESFTGNTSGVAIKYKLIGLEQVRSRKERGFKKGLQRRIELIGNVMQLKGGTKIDFRDIEITFTANIPANVQELAQIVGQLDGLVSHKRLLSLLPFVDDPAKELEELDKEKEPMEDDYGGLGQHTDGGEEDGADS